MQSEPDKVSNIERIKGMIEYWADVLLPLDYVVEIKEGNGGVEMAVDLDRAEYLCFSITIGRSMLEGDIPEDVHETIVHEMLHIVCSPYTRLAERTKNKPIRKELRDREEEMVTFLAKRIVAHTDRIMR